MNELKADSKKSRIFSLIEILLVVGFALIPLLMTFPYRVNIFLSWEGAYRLSEGQVPYRDFGMPLGYMYWVVPAFFFKIFGPKLFSLVIAQVFINIVSGLAFRSILKSLGVQPGVRVLSVLLYCISFSFFNFWPWYNHTVIVYQMVGLAFLMRYLFAPRPHWILLPAAALFHFFSFFTKQDGGGLAIVLSLALLVYHCFQSKGWRPLFIFTGSMILVGFAFIAPLARFSFGYWFNHGQPPHTARVAPFEILDEFFGGSQWIKFYLFVVLLLALSAFRKGKELLTSRREAIFLLLTLGILAEAAILQVTSYTPPDNNIFYHAFAFAFILSRLAVHLNLDFFRPRLLLVGTFGLLLWWSGIFWKYLQRIAYKALPQASAASPTGGNVVNRRTYMIFPPDTAEIPMSAWTFTGLKSFDRVYMPKPTVDGIHRLLQYPGLRNNPGLRVLNMAELTPLAVELPYKTETGTQTPLWHHLGVGMFNREAAMYEQRITKREYDLVLFEYIPTLNNFFPFRVRDSIRKHYILKDTFPAPRRGETKGVIEVYLKQ